MVMGSTPPSEKPVALITGGHKATAHEIALRLGRDHDMIVLVGMTEEHSGCEAAAKLIAESIDARCVSLDAGSPVSIEAAARWIDGLFGGRLDVLINHADAVLDRSVPGHTQPATFEATFEANVRGPLLVSKAMLPLLKRSGAGRIVNVCSGLGSSAGNSDAEWEFAPYRILCYNSSRAALHMQTVLFASELMQASTSIKVNAVDLGYTAQQSSDAAAPYDVEDGIRAVVRLATLPVDGPSGGCFNAERPVP